MDGRQFDDVTRFLGAGRSRRRLLRSVGIGLAAAVGAGGRGVTAAPAGKGKAACCPRGKNYTTTCLDSNGRDVCTDTLTDALNCGACDTLCGSGQTCVDGACTPLPGCPSGQTDCNGTCVNTNADASNCGGCGHACEFHHATAICINGACQMGACDSGYADCDGVAATGCESNLQTDNGNCGRCGNPCGSNQSCLAGSCGDPCAGLNCDDSNPCTSDSCAGGICGHVAVTAGTQCPLAGGAVGVCNELANCVQCLTARDCPSNLPCQEAICTGGACGLQEVGGDFGNCDTGERGICAQGTLQCVKGQQVCVRNVEPSTETCDGLDNDCDGTVDNGFDLATDVENCGGCGKSCSSANLASRSCTKGVCDGACAPGFGDCDNDKLSNGCETDLMTSATNCGACGNSCPQLITYYGATCRGGTECCAPMVYESGVLCCPFNQRPSTCTWEHLCGINLVTCWDHWDCCVNL